MNVIEKEKAFKIIAEARDGEEAIGLTEKLKPDISIIDIDMPNLNGLEVLRKINSSKIPTKPVIITMYKDEEFFNEAMDLGALGYLLKDGALVELIECLETVSENKHFISPKITDYLISRFERTKALIKAYPSLENLTNSEKNILKLISENLTSKAIAEKLYISEKTVENHRANISSKLDLKGRTSLLVFALKYKNLLN